MQNLIIQYQNLSLLNSLEYDYNLTSILIIIGMCVLCSLVAYGIKKFIENI